jgi:hypothetical protein
MSPLRTRVLLEVALALLERDDQGNKAQHCPN